MSKIDAVVNGIAFLTLAIGLGVGWFRSPALRETLVELFVPIRRREESKHDRELVQMTWSIYVAYGRRDHHERQDDMRLLSGLRAGRA
jgi:hypothetical protein